MVLCVRIVFLLHCVVAEIAELFRMTTDAFAPWIQPLSNNGQILSPWIISDDDIASELVAEWFRTIECLFTAFRGWYSLLSKLCT